MKILVENRITIKRKGTPVFQMRDPRASGETVRENILGFLNITPTETYLKMGAFEGEEMIDLFATKKADGKYDVTLAYHSPQAHFNGFFSESKECQFTTINAEGMGFMGLFKTISVKNDITKDGGRLVLKFKTVYSGVVTSIGEMIFEVAPIMYDLRS